ncbi:MAG: MlaD family protein [Acidobacteriota bacterium]
MLATDAHLSRRVGAVALAVIALAIMFFVFVYDRIDWGRHVRIHVRFHTTGGLAEGAPFVVAGRTVGKVETIALAPGQGDDRGVIVTIAIDAGEAPRLDAGGDVFVASKGALSARYLELGPPPQPTRPVHEGEELVGRDPPSLDRVLQRTWDNMNSLAAFADSIRPELEAFRAQLKELRGNVDAVPEVDRFAALVDDALGAADQLRQLREVALGGEPGAARIALTIDHARALLASARVSLARLGASAGTLGDRVSELRGKLGPKGDEAIAQLQLAIDRARAVIAKIDPLLAQVDALNASLANGDGSLMKLMHDPEFPEDAKDLGKILKRHPWRVIDHPSK